MNIDKFEEAYVQSQAQIALVLAESLGLISELKSAGEHGASVPAKDRQKAIERRTRRLYDVSKGQSPAATAAGIRAFHKSREEGETADRAVTRQVTAEKEQRRIEKKTPSQYDHRRVVKKRKNPLKPRTSIRISPEELT